MRDTLLDSCRRPSPTLLHTGIPVSLLLCALLFTLFTLFTQSATAQLLFTNDAQVSARALGMGHAYCAVANDAAAFAYNPAGASLDNSVMLSGMYASLHGSLGTPLANQSWGGLQYPMTDLTLAANWIRFQSADQGINPAVSASDLNQSQSVVKLPRTRSFWTQYEDAMSITLARKNIVNIDWGWSQYVLPVEIPVGLNLRYTHAQLNGESGSAFALDAGMMIRINLRDMFFSDDYPYLSFGWNWKNIGGNSMSWKSGHEDYYGSHSIIGFALIQPLDALESQVIVDYDHDSQLQAYSRVGMELRFRKYYFARCGFYGSAFCVGAGVDLRFFVVDYSYQSSSDPILGMNHQLNLAFRLERLFL